MTRLLILSFFFLLTSSLHGQSVETKVRNKIQTLAKENVDTFFTYSYKCNSELIPFDSCRSEEPQYLFWQQNGHSFFQKFDYCNNYKAQKLDTSNPLTFYLKNKSLIDKEAIKQPTYFEIKKGKHGTDTIVNTITVSHSCFHEFIVNIKGSVKHKTVNTYYLNYTRFDNGKLNVYRKHNQRTKLSALSMMTSDLIRSLENIKLEND